MPLTEDRRQQLDGIVQQMTQNKESDANIQTVVNDFKSKYETKVPPKKSPGFVESVKALPRTALNVGTNIAAFPFLTPQWAVEMQEKYEGKPYEGLLTKKLPSGKTVAGLSETVGEAIRKIGEPKTEAEKRQVELINLPFKGLAKVGEVAGGATKAITGSPSAGTLVEASINLAPLFFGRGAGKELVEKAITRKPTTIPSAIEIGMEKGVRPSVVGKKTAPQMKKYFSKAESAVKSIIENKENLEFIDKEGELVKGKLPTNLKTFSSAVDQTKKSIFEQYDRLRVEAGEKGAEVKLKSITKELDAVAQNTVLNDLNPASAKYAEELSMRLLGSEKYTVAEAQQAIALLNDRLEGFYKNPTYETASKAYVDSLVANSLRKSLDSVIEGTTGEKYQVLKNRYGALKEIEKDVQHRSLIDARKNIKGLIDFSDVFSGYHVIRGILSMNPATVGAGLASKTIAAIYRKWNDPNRIVRNMFSGVEKLGQGRSLTPIRSTIAEKALPIPPRLTGKEKEPENINRLIQETSGQIGMTQ